MSWSFLRAGRNSAAMAELKTGLRNDLKKASRLEQFTFKGHNKETDLVKKPLCEIMYYNFMMYYDFYYDYYVL